MTYAWNTSSVKGELAYERLAAACTFIVEVPGTIDFSPPYAVRYGGLGVTTKVHRSIFVGAERIAPKEPVEFGDISYFVPELGHYQPVAADQRSRFENRLAKVLFEKDQPSLAFGVRIHVVSELPFNRGLNVDASLAVGIAAALLLATDQLDCKRLDTYRDQMWPELVDDNTYRKLFRLAWRFEALLSKYRPEGHHLHAALTSGEHGSTIFWRVSLPAPSDTDFLSEDAFKFCPSGWHLNVLSQVVPALGGAGRERFRLDPLLAFDLAVVYVGKEVDSEDAYAVHRLGYRRIIDSYTRTAIEWLEPLERAVTWPRPPTNPEVKPLANPEVKPRFLRMNRPGETLEAQGISSTTAADNLMDLGVVKSMEIFAALVELATTGATADASRRFIAAVDQAQDIYRLLDLSSILIDEARNLIRSELSSLIREQVAVRLMGAGRGGCLLVVAPKGTLATTLPLAMDRVREALHLSPSVHWTSFGDGYSPHGRGLRVVQDLQNGERFPFRTDKSLSIREWVGGVMQSARLYGRAEWQHKRTTFDLVINFDERPYVWFSKEIRPPTEPNFNDKVNRKEEQSPEVPSSRSSTWSHLNADRKEEQSPEVPSSRSSTSSHLNADRREEQSPEIPPSTSIPSSHLNAPTADDGTRTHRTKTNTKSSPEQAKKILLALFAKAPPGATSAEIDGQACIDVTNSGSYRELSHLEEVLTLFLGEQAFEVCGFATESRGRVSKAEYALRIAPTTKIRIALVQRWCGA